MGQFAVGQMKLGMRKPRYQLLVMGCDDDGRSNPMQLFQQMHQPHRDAVVHIAGWLVREQEVRACDDGPCNGDALFLAARQSRGACVQLIREPYPSEELRYVLVDLRLAGAGDPKWQCDVFRSRQMVDQPKILKDDADAPPQRRQNAPGRRRDVVAEKRYQSARRALGKIHQAQQRRFARAAGAGQKVKRPRLQAKGNVMEDFLSKTVSHADVLKPDDFVDFGQ